MPGSACSRTRRTPRFCKGVPGFPITAFSCARAPCKQRARKEHFRPPCGVHAVHSPAPDTEDLPALPRASHLG